MAIPEKTHQEIRKRAGYCFEYCKYTELYTATKLEADQIIPESKEGTDDKDNLSAACRNCNGSKLVAQTAIDPETDEEVPLYNPRIQKWLEHFKLSDDFTEIIGITPIGRAIVNRLKINRDYVVKARPGWRSGGWNPPLD